MIKILILSNDSAYTYNFRKEIIKALIDEGYDVIISCPYGKEIDKLTALGAIHVDSTIDRRGINPVNDIKLFFHYKKLVKKYMPDILLTYTIKPNIYGGLIAKLTKTPYMPNITGLGTAVENKGLLQIITIRLYKAALKKANIIFFQNKDNMNFMVSRGIKGKNQILLPGSGVNIQHFSYLDYPKDETLHFLFIGRVMKAKGIDYYLQAAKYIKSRYSNVIFHILGGYEEDYKALLDEYESDGIINYHGRVNDVREYHKIAHCTIHPTYYPEGMSNVLLESAASGRPVIASNRSGCKEIIEDGKNGYLVESNNLEDLVDKIETFINLTYIEKKQMGIYGREKVVKEFDRSIVINSYIKEIKKVGDER